MNIVKYYCRNYDDGLDQSFWFTSESKRDKWIRKHGGHKHYYTWEVKPGMYHVEWCND